jgi:hypothetical protein
VVICPRFGTLYQENSGNLDVVGATKWLKSSRYLRANRQCLIIVMLDVNPQGLPDFSGDNLPKREQIYQMTIKYTESPQKIPNCHKIYQLTSKYTNISKIYPKWDFWSENIPSGIPATTEPIDSFQIDFLESVDRKRFGRKKWPKNCSKKVFDT